MDESARIFRPDQRAASPELAALYANECQSCGVCCIYYTQYPFGIPVYDLDIQPPKRFVQIGPRSIVPNGTNRFLRIKLDDNWRGFNRCAALEGKPRAHVSCSIYERRPMACRNYAPSSADCLKIRQWAGIEPIDDGYGHS